MSITSKTVSAAFLSAALSISAANAQQAFLYAHGQPQTIDLDRRLNQQRFVFSSRELAKGDFITEGAVLDQSIGMLCEWRERADLNKTTHGTVVSAKVREFDARCMSSKQAPQTWMAFGKARQVYSNVIGSGLIHSSKRPNLIVEWSSSIEPGSYVRTSMIRSVDINKGEVCLDITKAHLVGLTTYSAYTEHRLGCFPLKDSVGEYADQLMSSLKIQAL